MPPVAMITSSPLQKVFTLYYFVVDGVCRPSAASTLIFFSFMISALFLIMYASDVCAFATTSFFGGNRATWTEPLIVALLLLAVDVCFLVSLLLFSFVPI